MGLSARELITSFFICAKYRRIVLPIYTWPAFIGILIASNGIPPPLETLKILLSVTFIGYCVYFYNDLIDLEDDIKNRELGDPIPADRPLGSGRVPRDLLKKYAIFSGMLGVFISALINVYVVIIHLLCICVGIIYSAEPIRLKKRFIIKQITIASGAVMVTLAGGLTLGVLNVPILYLVTINAVYLIGINPLVDLRDVKGDEIAGIKTIPVAWGPEMTIRFTIGILTAVSAANIVGFLNLGFNLAMTLLMLIIFSALIYVVYPLLKKWNDPIVLDKVMNRRIIPLHMVFQFVIFLGFLF